MTRPQRLVLVAGTGTDIGKTLVGGEVLARLRAGGADVAARKPAQSADAHDPRPSDADVLAAATGEAPTDVCLPHRSYSVAMAPSMAAAALGLAAPTLAELVEELRWPDRAVDVGWLETVGGPRSPIAVDGDAVDLADVVEPDLVVLVADAGLGTVNAVLTCLAPLARHRTVVFLNRFRDADDLHRRNLAWLRDHHHVDPVTDLDALAGLVLE